jgi:hypothetical protein
MTAPNQLGQAGSLRRIGNPPRAPERKRPAALLLALFSCSLGLAAGSPAPTEYQVKAAYLSNFGRFVGWSGSAAGGDSPFYVCVLGEDPFGAALDSALAGQKIGPSPLAARRISRIEDAQDCRILFISSSENSRIKTILESLGRMSILTVGETPDFLKRGGMIQFVPEGKRVRFSINLAAAQRAGLNPGSDLLKVAAAVRREP